MNGQVIYVESFKKDRQEQADDLEWLLFLEKFKTFNDEKGDLDGILRTSIGPLREST